MKHHHTFQRILTALDMVPGILAFCIQVAAMAAAFAVILRIMMPPSHPDTSTDLIMVLTAGGLILMAAGASWYSRLGTPPGNQQTEPDRAAPGRGGSKH